MNTTKIIGVALYVISAFLMLSLGIYAVEITFNINFIGLITLISYFFVFIYILIGYLYFDPIAFLLFGFFEELICIILFLEFKGILISSTTLQFVLFSVLFVLSFILSVNMLFFMFKDLRELRKIN